MMKKEMKTFLEKSFRTSYKKRSFDSLLLTSQPFLEKINTGVSLGVFLRLKHREYAQYLEMSIDANDYLTADHFFFDYQSTKLFSKAEFFPVSLILRKRLCPASSRPKSNASR